ncbi:TPA: phosphotransferase RcsD [Klebsiella pneumoniae]|nr:phosphotransferase RcsD [Klebsiella pneumoniae]
MTPKKFSLIPGNISRFFILMVIVLLATMGVMIQSAVNAWLKEKSYQVVDVSHALHQRIDAWRYATWQIYDNIAATSVNTASGGLQETRLKQDVYYLEKPRRKTEALIFGSHDSSTLEMTQKMSDYLDILWGAETIPWSMYYLNGLDNSLILVSTLPLKDLSSSFKESTISSVVESRRAEMLLQANTLGTVISNPIADHLLPHLNLQNITNMADQHQGVIQATVNNEQYEIRQYRSQVAPRTQILIIRDQDREVLVNKKLKQAQRLYEKNQQGRAAFMQHIGSALKQPALTLAAEAAALSSTENRTLAQHADELVKLIDDIQLANLLESDAWKTNQTLFSVQELIDDVVPEVLPAMKRKGLQLLINNALPAGEQRYGDREALRRTLVLLIQYSVTTTPIGKITLDVCQDESASDRLTFRILDTGNGVSANEIDNMHFPYLNETQSDLYGKANALTFWLCDRMTRKLGGQLTIKARESLGTRYTLHLKMPASEEAPEAGEHLLDDVIVLLDVTSSEVRRIVTRQLESWGASCITPDDRATSQAFDLYLTDNPSNLTASGLLLSDDEVGIRKIGPGQLRVNFNISTAMQEAILQLIEQQLAEEAVQPVTSGNESNAELHASGYYALFADTVPDDVQRLYTEIEAGDFAALAQTAHRLKGAFAMLNLIPGKQLCETLEHLIREKDAQGIEKYISDIDAYVKSLL